MAKNGDALDGLLELGPPGMAQEEIGCFAGWRTHRY